MKKVFVIPLSYTKDSDTLCPVFICNSFQESLSDGIFRIELKVNVLPRIQITKSPTVVPKYLNSRVITAAEDIILVTKISIINCTSWDILGVLMHTIAIESIIER